MTGRRKGKAAETADGKKARLSRAGKLAHEKRMALPLGALAEARHARGLSQAKVADMAGMDATTYSRIERCRVNPFPAQAEAISMALSVPVDELVGDRQHATLDQDAQVPVEAYPEATPADPVDELEKRVTALENLAGALAEEVGAMMGHLGEQRAKIDAIEAQDNQPVVLDRNGLPMRAGSWYVDCTEQAPAKAAPRYIASVELHEVEGKGLLAYFPNGAGQFGIAAVEDGRCPTAALVDIVERGRKAAAR